MMKLRVVLTMMARMAGTKARGILMVMARKTDDRDDDAGEEYAETTTRMMMTRMAKMARMARMTRMMASRADPIFQARRTPGHTRAQRRSSMEAPLAMPHGPQK